MPPRMPRRRPRTSRYCRGPCLWRWPPGLRARAGSEPCDRPWEPALAPDSRPEEHLVRPAAARPSAGPGLDLLAAFDGRRPAEASSRARGALPERASIRRRRPQRRSARDQDPPRSSGVTGVCVCGTRLSPRGMVPAGWALTVLRSGLRPRWEPRRGAAPPDADERRPHYRRTRRATERKASRTGPRRPPASGRIARASPGRSPSDRPACRRSDRSCRSGPDHRDRSAGTRALPGAGRTAGRTVPPARCRTRTSGTLTPRTSQQTAPPVSTGQPRVPVTA